LAKEKKRQVEIIRRQGSAREFFDQGNQKRDHLVRQKKRQKKPLTFSLYRHLKK